MDKAGTLSLTQSGHLSSPWSHQDHPAGLLCRESHPGPEKGGRVAGIKHAEASSSPPTAPRSVTLAELPLRASGSPTL